MIKRSGNKVLDRVVLSAALGNEHYEMSAYRALLIPVKAMGASEVEKLLKFNLDQEVHTSKELETMLRKIAG